MTLAKITKVFLIQRSQFTHMHLHLNLPQEVATGNPVNKTIKLPLIVSDGVMAAVGQRKVHVGGSGVLVK